jgi:hypothetical protein
MLMTAVGPWFLALTMPWRSNRGASEAVPIFGRLGWIIDVREIYDQTALV